MATRAEHPHNAGAMNKKFAEFIVAACEEADLNVRLYEDYSGRAMFGHTTTGVVVGQYHTAFDVLAAVMAYMSMYPDAYNELTDEVRSSEFKASRSDSLGRDTIYY